MDADIADEVDRLKRQVSDLSAVLVAVLRERHDSLKHADDFPGSHSTAFMNECADSLCQKAWALHADGGEWWPVEVVE